MRGIPSGTPSDKPMDIEYVIIFKNVLNHFGGWWQNNQVLGQAYIVNTPRKTT